MKFIVICATFIFTISCSTLKTVNPENNHVVIDHNGRKSYCHSIPRIYSGVARNLCKANGEPSERTSVGNRVNGTPIVVIDTICSAIVDTIILPYTITRQIKDGNIPVN